MGCWVVYSWFSKTNSRWKYVKNCYANNGMVEYKHLPKSADINYDMNNYVASINWFNIHVIMGVAAIIINHQSSTSCYQPWWSINPTCSKANSAGAGLRSWVVCSASFMQSKSARPAMGPPLRTLMGIPGDITLYTFYNCCGPITVQRAKQQS